MEDVLFYQNYTPVADVSTIAICIIFLFLLQSTYTIKQRNLTLFYMADFFVIIAAGTNIIFHQAADNLTADNTVWVYVFRNISYISLILTEVLFCSYVRNLVDISAKYRKYLDIALWGMFAVFAAFEISGPFTKLGFYIDSDLHIHQNYYLDVFRFAYIYYDLIFVGMLVAYRKKFILKMFRCIRNVVLVSFLIMAIQAEFLQTSYTCITYTFTILALLFLFHYNSYDTNTGTLDSRAFNAYIRDMKNNKFSLICVYLQDMSFDKLQGMDIDFFRFSERLFKDSCTFRIRDDKLVLVYRDEKNKNAAQVIDKLIRDFDKLYEKYRIDYRLVLIHSDEALRHGDEYLALNEFIASKVPVNAAYTCQKKDIENFQKSRYILEELRDIHVRQNLEDERVTVYCQPVLNTQTNLFTSAEALMRLELPECGMVFPDQFIPLAEKRDYIHTLSKIILNKTCKQIKRLESRGCQIERISVNFSIQELRDKNFCDDVTGIIQKNNIPYEKIAVELTESRNEKDFENVKNIMNNLQKLGVKFYLDDFGTGYSNFERIIGLPIDIIKFDRSLTIMAGRNQESRFLVGSFSDIFKKSNYQILFEGIEDEQDEMQCKEMNALYLQGYKYSKPIPIEQLESFLKKVS